MTEHLRSAGYFRVSTQSQADDSHVSLPVQREKFATHNTTKRYIPSGEFTDVESGRKDSRKEYQRLLALARSKDIDVIVVQRLDRFGRNPREILRRVWELQDLGVTVEATDEDLTQEIAMMLHAFMAGEESKRISARVIPTMERVARSGRWVGREPFGYILNQDPASPERGHLTIDEPKAAIVRRVFDLYVSGRLGVAAIAARLNAERTPSSMGGIWWAGAVMAVLTMPTYVGRPTWRGIAYPGGCPAIVSDETWEGARDVQRSRTTSWNRQPANSAFILRGLVRCACERLRSCRVPDLRRGYRYYECNVRHATGTCRIPNIRAERLESFVIDTIRSWELCIPAFVPVDDSAERRSQIIAERTRIRGKIERVKRRRDAAYDELMDRVITREDYQAGNSRYVSELAELEAELAHIRDAVTPARDLFAAIATLDAFRVAVESGTPAEIHALLVDLVASVQIDTLTGWRVIPHPELAGVVSAPPAG